MEELSKIAMAYYQASSDDLQKLAHDFFEAMDNDGDGKIDQQEFFEFMRDEGYAQMTKPSFFNQLDLDRNGTLDFFEVMTVYYIVKSGRPFCDWCNKFITSTYLSCVGCLEDQIGGSFYLCLDYYSGQKCDHTHNDVSRFLDNYSLLEAMNKSILNELLGSTFPPVDTPSNSAIIPYGRSRSAPLENNVTTRAVHNNNNTWNIQNHHNTWNIQNSSSNHYQPEASSTAIVPQRNKLSSTLAILNSAVNIVATGSSVCSIL